MQKSLNSAGPAVLRVAVNAVPLLSPFTGSGQNVNSLMLEFKATGQLDANYFYGYGWSRQLRSTPLSANANKLKIAVRRFLPNSYALSRWVRKHPETGNKLKTHMQQMLEDDALSTTLSVRGLQRAQLFSWEKTAQQTLDVYQLSVCQHS